MSSKCDHGSGLFPGIATGSAAPQGIEAGSTSTGWIHWQGWWGGWQGLLRIRMKETWHTHTWGFCKIGTSKEMQAGSNIAVCRGNVNQPAGRAGKPSWHPNQAVCEVTQLPRGRIGASCTQSGLAWDDFPRTLLTRHGPNPGPATSSGLPQRKPPMPSRQYCSASLLLNIKEKHSCLPFSVVLVKLQHEKPLQKWHLFSHFQFLCIARKHAFLPMKQWLFSPLNGCLHCHYIFYLQKPLTWALF